MATRIQPDTATSDMKQHLDTGGRGALVVKPTPMADPVSYSGDCPFWTVDLCAAPAPDEADAAALPVVVCEFERARLKVSRRNAAMPYSWRHIDADEIHFIHRGSARILTEFGEIDAPAGRFVFITRGVGYRVEPTSDDFMSLIFESDEVVSLEEDVNTSEIPIVHPRLPDNAEQPEDGKWEERLHTASWSLSVIRDVDPLRTLDTARDGHPVFAFDIGNIPAHTPDAPLGIRPFIIFRGPKFHLEVAMPKTPMPFFHRNVRANETVFAHYGRGDRESMLGKVSTPTGSLSNYPRGIDHRVGDRGGESICLIWETGGDVTVDPSLLPD